MLLDKNFAPVAFSPSYATLAGLRIRQLRKRIAQGASVFEILGTDPRKDQENALSSLNSKRAMQFAEEAVHNAELNEFTCYISYMPVIDPANDEAQGVIQTFRDVSAEARMQFRYKELLEEERHQKQRLEDEVLARTKDLSEALEQVTRLSKTDPLTGLLNRRAFTELAEQSIKMARRHNRTVGILLGDLDFFKSVNDNFGHQVGDELLVATSGVLLEMVRDTDPVGRFGGEEFIIMLTETTKAAVSTVGERIRQKIESLDFGEDGPKPTISLGMTFFPDHGGTLDELVKCADLALYSAKETGRNRVTLYDDKLKSAPNPIETTVLKTARVLVVGEQVESELSEELFEKYEVVLEKDSDKAIARCARERFDAIVASHPNAEDSSQFLRMTLRDSPEALRVMVIDSRDVFPAAESANVARIDSYLLRGEFKEHLVYALDEGLSRREDEERRKVFASTSIKNLFATRVQELDWLIKEEAVDFAFQPIINSSERSVFAYESLCRAKHPIFSNPSILFEAAVQAGLLWELGHVCRKKALEGLKKFNKDRMIFVNLHPGELQDPHLLDQLLAYDCSRVVFEITERAAIPDLKKLDDIMAQLREKGARFAIDDLGAGYASLNAVVALEPDFVKIDMMMIRNIHSAPIREKLVKRVVDFANDVGIKVIAEGIETKDEAKVIKEIGCHYSQGYFYGKPRIV